MLSKIINRTSCRSYLSKPITKNIIKQLKAVINSSPTAINTQPFSAIFITNKNTINEIIKFNFQQSFITQAPLLVLFIADLNRTKIKLGFTGYTSALVDSTIACSLLMMAANELDLGTCILGGFRRMPDDVNKFLNIKGQAAPTLGLAIGYRDKPGTKVPKINKCYDDKYDLDKIMKEVTQYNQIMKSFYKSHTGKEMSWQEVVSKNLMKLDPGESEKQIKKIFDIK